MRILFDTNIVLDVLLAREPHAFDAARLFSLVDEGRMDGLLCATTLTTIYYLAEKSVGRQQAQRSIRELMAMFEVAPVGARELESALGLGFKDYEDAVVHESARNAGAVGIVTRNVKDYRSAKLSIYSPKELLGAVQSLEEE